MMRVLDPPVKEAGSLSSVGESGRGSAGFSIPYSNDVPPAIHENVREQVENFAIRKVGMQERDIDYVRQNFSKIITPARWGVMKDNPEHFWALATAYATEEDYRDRFKVIAPEVTRGLSNNYIEARGAWHAVAMNLFREDHGRTPHLWEEWEIASQDTSLFNAFYVLWVGATKQAVVYPWAQAAKKAELEMRAKESKRDGSLLYLPVY